MIACDTCDNRDTLVRLFNKNVGQLTHFFILVVQGGAEGSGCISGKFIFELAAQEGVHAPRAGASPSGAGTILIILSIGAIARFLDKTNSPKLF